MKRRALLTTWLGFAVYACVPSVFAQSPVDQLLTLDDTKVKGQIKEQFFVEIRKRIPMLVPPSQNQGFMPAMSPLPNKVFLPAATLLGALAISSISSYGFNSTVAGAQATRQLQALLNPNNKDFVALSRDMYDNFFDGYAVDSNGNSYSDIIGSNSTAELGEAFAITLTSPAFIATQMLLFKTAPAGFIQRFKMYMFIVQRLSPARYAEVLQVWDKLLGLSSVPWTTYEGVTSGNFGSNTLMADMTTAIGIVTTVKAPVVQFDCSSGFCVDGSDPGVRAYGSAVQQWISAQNATDFPGVFTGAGVNNTETFEN